MHAEKQRRRPGFDVPGRRRYFKYETFSRDPKGSAGWNPQAALFLAGFAPAFLLPALAAPFSRPAPTVTLDAVPLPAAALTCMPGLMSASDVAVPSNFVLASVVIVTSAAAFPRVWITMLFPSTFDTVPVSPLAPSPFFAALAAALSGFLAAAWAAVAPIDRANPIANKVAKRFIAVSLPRRGLVSYL